MAHLPVARSHRRFIGPDAMRDGTTVKARLKQTEDCEEWDVLLTDISAVKASGIEVHCRNADSATPLFTEVTPHYFVQGVYAGVSIGATQMFGTVDSHTPSYRSSNPPSHRSVPKMVTSLYDGVVTQFNYSPRRWRHGIPLLMGPEYRPETTKPPRVTWYPVESNDLFHSNIAPLLAVAFGTWYKKWNTALIYSVEHVPLDSGGSDADPPLLTAADSNELKAFLAQQREFQWTRLSYVTAKVVGSLWSTQAEVCEWIQKFYEDEVKDAKRVGDPSTANLLQDEYVDLIQKFDRLQREIARFHDVPSTKPFVSTMLANATALNISKLTSFMEKSEEKKIQVEEEDETGISPTLLIENPIRTIKEIIDQNMQTFDVMARKMMMGIYKQFIVHHLRGQALSEVAPNSYGVIQIT